MLTIDDKIKKLPNYKKYVVGGEFHEDWYYDEEIKTMEEYLNFFELVFNVEWEKPIFNTNTQEFELKTKHSKSTLYWIK